MYEVSGYQVEDGSTKLPSNDVVVGKVVVEGMVVGGVTVPAIGVGLIGVMIGLVVGVENVVGDEIC